MKKTIFLLNIDNYAPEITKITLPFIKHYAKRLGAEIQMITERKFPEWPLTYEKLQIYELAQKVGGDWFLYVDSDVLIHPECPDFTIYLPKGTVSFHSPDISSIRFRPDKYAYRDGRYIAPGNWFMVASDLCLDLWRPLEMFPGEAVGRITPTPAELKVGITAEHLIDDFALASNIARFGLAFKSFQEIYKQYGFEERLQHWYLETKEQKIENMMKAIKHWQLEHFLGT